MAKGEKLDCPSPWAMDNNGAPTDSNIPIITGVKYLLVFIIVCM